MIAYPFDISMALPKKPLVWVAPCNLCSEFHVPSDACSWIYAAPALSLVSVSSSLAPMIAYPFDIPISCPNNLSFSWGPWNVWSGASSFHLIKHYALHLSIFVRIPNRIMAKFDNTKLILFILSMFNWSTTSKRSEWLAVGRQVVWKSCEQSFVS